MDFEEIKSIVRPIAAKHRGDPCDRWKKAAKEALPLIRSSSEYAAFVEDAIFWRLKHIAEAVEPDMPPRSCKGPEGSRPFFVDGDGSLVFDSHLYE